MSIHKNMLISLCLKSRNGPQLHIIQSQDTLFSNVEGAVHHKNW